MRRSFLSHFVKTAAALAVAMSTSTVILTLSATSAFAESASASGRGSSGRSGTRTLTSQNDVVVNNSGGGATSRRDAKASHVVVADSTAAELDTYREHRLTLNSVLSEQELALAEYIRLTDLSDEAIAAEFPDGSYDVVLAAAAQTFARLKNDAALAQAATDYALLQVTGGRLLSEDAMTELHAYLGF